MQTIGQKTARKRQQEMTCASAPERFTLLADTRERDRGRAAQYCLNCALPIHLFPRARHEAHDDIQAYT